ncbi:MAG: peptidylprolyl isomerase [Anaerolineae bacterium]|nr:peptidylprolyl isomerase [Anaerolineae bacterium]
MPVLRSDLRRFAWLIVLTLATVALLAGCGGKSNNGASGESLSAASDAGEVSVSASQPTQPAQPTEEALAARVNGEPITLAQFVRERERRSLGMMVEPATQDAFDAQVLASMIDQVLINQGAAKAGIVISEEEIDAELTIQAELAAAGGTTLEEVAASQLYTMDEYRAVIRDMLTVQRLSDVVANVSPYAEQVHSRHILVTDEALARNLIAQIQAGADFAQLATQYSLDSSTARLGGDLDWVSEGDLLQPEVERAVFALGPGDLAAYPVQSSLGYHVVQTLERVQDRPLSATALAEKRQNAFLAWLEGQRQMATIERFVGAVVP